MYGNYGKILSECMVINNPDYYGRKSVLLYHPKDKFLSSFPELQKREDDPNKLPKAQDLSNSLKMKKKVKKKKKKKEKIRGKEDENKADRKKEKKRKVCPSHNLHIFIFCHVICHIVCHRILFYLMYMVLPVHCFKCVHSFFLCTNCTW